MDIVSREKRSQMMSGVRAKNTRPEKEVRSVLFAMGYRYRLHRRDLPGAPDIVFPGKKIAIFVHGCFWHQHAGCPLVKLPSSNVDFWLAKLSRNVERDRRNVDKLVSAGWRVLTIWECATRGRLQLSTLGCRIREWMEGDEQIGEIPVPMD